MTADEVQQIRQRIPALSRRAYLNFGGAGAMPRSSLNALVAALERQQAAGPFSAESLLQGGAELTDTKAALAGLLRTDPDSLLLTESVSAACRAVLWGCDWKPGDEIIVTDCENPSIAAVTMNVARRFQLRVNELKVRGRSEEAILASLESLLTERSRVLIASHVSWIDGQLLPLSEMASLVHECEPDMAVLADGAQAVGCIDVDLNLLKCDFYAFTGSKWVCGPEGCAGFYIAPHRRERIQPGHNGTSGSPKFEAGTRPIALLAGLRESLHFHASAAPFSERAAHMAHLSRLARAHLGELAVPGGVDGIVAFRLPHEFDPARARGLVHFLEARDVLIREIPGRELWRICLHYFSTENEIQELSFLLSAYLEKFQNRSVTSERTLQEMSH